ncbi:hypothetical protein [Rhizobium hidalgonense]|uniref:hypothetical protein n=1 Tax=Rhizobium hidalgonense TaxID=1538159 RepID=UPI00287249D0|nr:hypothetical protein [Rhizobium hidalgonense]MDR9813055.1 hypothetical protein [Rhizobium hidalgonense]
MPTNEADIRNAALEEAAKAVLAYSPYDYGDSPAAKYFYEVRVKDAVNEIAAAIRALKSDPAPVPDPKPFTFADPVRQAEWERQRKERGE